MSCLDKRSGRTFGPPANKKCIFFIDDLNMPYVDQYDTQCAAQKLKMIPRRITKSCKSQLEEDMKNIQKAEIGKRLFVKKLRYFAHLCLPYNYGDNSQSA
eukprot:4056120-Amphidinium_carterae.1